MPEVPESRNVGWMEVILTGIFWGGTLIWLGGEESFLSTGFRHLFFRLLAFKCIISGAVPPNQRRF